MALWTKQKLVQGYFLDVTSSIVAKWTLKLLNLRKGVLQKYGLRFSRKSTTLGLYLNSQ